jgi:FkbM family methyltransferase
MILPLQRRAEELRLHNVSFHPAQHPDDMPAVYCSDDMLVFPTLEDAWGLVVTRRSSLDCLYWYQSRRVVPGSGCRRAAPLDPLNPTDFAAKLRLAVAGQLPRPDPPRLKPIDDVTGIIIRELDAALRGIAEDPSRRRGTGYSVHNSRIATMGKFGVVTSTARIPRAASYSRPRSSPPADQVADEAQSLAGQHLEIGMPRQIMNLLRNQKEWLELHNVPFLGRTSAQKLFARYAMDDRSVEDLWEADPDALYVEPIVGADAVVFGVGANLGTFCYTVEQAKQAVRLVAFEPIPVLAQRLRALFKDIVVMELALCDAKTIETFRIPYIDGRRCNSRGSLAPIVDTGTYTEIKVQTGTLDNVSATMALQRLDLVKIDVEGHELEVVKGGEQTLRKHQPLLLIEIEQRHHGSTPIDNIWAFIEGLGYQGFFLNRQSLEFDPVETFSVPLHQRHEDMGTHRYINNFLFISRAADLKTLREKLTSHLLKLLGSRSSHWPVAKSAR